MEWALLVKWLHLVAVISWMAGLLYLPRLYVYHVDAEPSSQLSETFKIMERRLLKVIMTPAMIVVWVSGLFAAYFFDSYGEGWFYFKVLLVLVLSGVHFMLAKYRLEFEQDLRFRSDRFFRIMNEIPTVLMIGIVFLVVFKPF